ncbi:MAG: AraC family transcriptional regulator [Lachnospiraceae bacterium]|jgi:AraC-like DNA-binding protein|nr:AraC family transcriptional regulator [Lachnospiraceae bacterium]MCI1453424.1 AraC family transcriptional regulator [Lachnospiraceae bacterium]
MEEDMNPAQNSILQMTLEFFHRLGLNASVQRTDDLITPKIDLGIREHLFPLKREPIASLLAPRKEGAVQEAAESPLVIAEDRFECRYLVVRLPEEGNKTPGIFLPAGIHLSVDPGEYEGITAGAGGDRAEAAPFCLLAGPYLPAPISLSHIRSKIRQYALPESLLTYFAQYYSTLPVQSQTELFAPYLLSLGHALYGGEDPAISFLSASGASDPIRREADAISEIAYSDKTRELLQLRYDKEEEMMNFIAEGNAEAAMRIEDGPYFHSMESRAPTKIRDVKNKMVILNTLCRKGAQRAGIHPVYLDELSRRMAVKIENAATLSELDRLPREMIRKYSFLVQSLDTRMFTPTIRKAVNYIDEHYADPDLSLQTLAAALQMNKSYLESTFHRETGSTVISYLNALRIRRACLRLNTTADSIGEIAAQVGIPNLNYFTRLFRKEKGLTPSAYRKMIRS